MNILFNSVRLLIIDLFVIYIHIIISFCFFYFPENIIKKSRLHNQEDKHLIKTKQRRYALKQIGRWNEILQMTLMLNIRFKFSEFSVEVHLLPNRIDNHQ